MIAAKTPATSKSNRPDHARDGAAPASEITVGTAPSVVGRLQQWLSADLARMMGRLERIDLMDRTLRDQAALRAESFWDDDRRLLALDLGDRIAGNPARVVAKLRATPQGCDWLIEQWGWLQSILDAGKTWDEFHTSRAFDLLGIAPEHREAAADRLADPARLVRDERQALAVQRTRVVESDALERSLARADLSAPTTPEYRQLKRYESATHRRMTWALALLEQAPGFLDVLAPAGETAAEPTPDPTNRPRTAEPPSPLPQSWVSPTVPMIPTPVGPSPAPTRRPDPARLRAKARDAARRRRDDRPDR